MLQILQQLKSCFHAPLLYGSFKACNKNGVIKFQYFEYAFEKKLGVDSLCLVIQNGKNLSYPASLSTCLILSCCVQN